MPWASKASTILQSWFLGSELGNGLADILLGTVNPSGKLPISFPISLKNNPSYGNFPGENDNICYAEGLLVGYRHYTTREIPTLFCFGHGLSYTTFTYSNLTLPSPNSLSTGGKIEVTLSVANSGERAGDAVVQLYISAPTKEVFRPLRELQGFTKLMALEPGESRQAKLSLGCENFSHWDEGKGRWVVDKGTYRVSIGQSSEDMVLDGEVLIEEAIEC